MFTRATLAAALIFFAATGAIMTHAADYGKALEPTAVLDMRGAMDAVVSGNHLFVAGYRCLYVADISDPLHPKEVAKVRFNGLGRQIEIEGGIACVTARQDGLFIFDVSNPAEPRQVSHYDTIELATGIDMHGDLAFVAQRQYGIEIVDISDPANPKHVSHVRTGEAQSVVVRDHTLYVGDWGSSQITVIDIADPRNPRIVSRSDIDGFGDGVDVQGNFLYASTGHHSRAVKTRPKGTPLKEGVLGYGAGHGLEIWSIENPEKPVYVSRIKFPVFYKRGDDMWTPVASGKYVIAADTHNGVFVVDVSDPKQPRAVAHYSEHFVAGIAVGDGAIYAACRKQGLVVLPAPGMAEYCAPERGKAVALPPAPAPQARDHRIYRPGGQIRDIAFLDDYAVIAAGAQGVRIVTLWPEVREVSQIPTSDVAYAVDTCGNRLYVSENGAGLGIYEHTGQGAFQEIGRFQEKRHQALRYVRVNGQNRYAVAESRGRFHFIDVSAPSSPNEVFMRKVGIIYGNQMSHGLVDGRYMYTSDHGNPLRWHDLKADSPEKLDTGIDLAKKLRSFDGAVSLGDRLLVTDRGGYHIVPALATDMEHTPLYKCRGVHLRGKPSVAGDTLVVVNRPRSTLWIVDIADPTKPRLLRQLETEGNPGAAVIRNGSLIVADGYEGLLIYDDFANTPASGDR